jgi:hypothetical protein
MKGYIQQQLFITVLLWGVASLAHAQATRTWVSGVGDDANPCSRTAPCKTFAGAISKTAAGGEISVLDPGSFGAVTITKSITINGDGTLAGILSAGTNGIVVNAGASDLVVIRNVSINGARTGINGIRYLGGATLVVENCTISGVSMNAIDVALVASGNLVVKNTTLIGGAVGIRIFGPLAGRVTGVVEQSRILGAAIGVHSQLGLTHITNSVISGNTAFGVITDGGTINVANSALTNNAVAAQAQPGTTIRLSNNDVSDNLIGLGCGGGTLASSGNNRISGNVGGVGPTCSPNATITLQ